MQRKAIRATVGGRDIDIPIGTFAPGQYAYFDGAQLIGAAGGGGGGGGSAAGFEPLLTMYCESEPDALAVEAFLGRPIDAMTAYTDETTLTANTFPFTSQWPSGRKLVLSHALMPIGGNMAQYAAGTFDATYQTCANNLIPYRNRIVCIRIGWEFNMTAGVYAWNVGGPGTNQTSANYAASFARFAQILRRTLPEIPIEWCALWDNTLADPWYPGDQYVDIIGNDVYLNSAYWSNDFNNALASANCSLQWQEAFARAHGKMMNWSEWSVNYDTGSFVTAMAGWMRRPRQTRVFSQGFWNSDLVFSGAFATHPVNKAAYIAAYGV